MTFALEHASKLINDEIIFVFNEFDMLVDKNNNTRLSEELKRNLYGFYEQKFYNITDGLATAMNKSALDYSHLNGRINKLVNQVEFDYKDYFKILNRLKRINNINLIRSILFIENYTKEILFTEVTDKIKLDAISTLNSLETSIVTSEKVVILSKIIKNKTVVIIDSVLPKYYIQAFYDNSFKIYYTGSEEYYLENKNLFSFYGYGDCIIKIQDITLEEYFNEIYKYVEADKTEKLLLKLIRNKDNNLISKIMGELEDREILNLINRHEVLAIDYRVIPYIILWFCKNQNFASYFNIIFKGFQSRYNCDLINSLKEFHKVLLENNLIFIITPIILDELKLFTEQRLNEFFTFLNECKQFQIYSSGKYNYINEIFKATNASLKDYAEIKFVEYAIKNDKPFLLSDVDMTGLNYIEISKSFCEYVLEDKDISLFHLDSLPESLKNILFEFKNNYEKIVNSEWIHQDGIYSCNNTLSPFSIKMDRKHDDYVEERMLKYNGVRPYITNNLIYSIELDKINIINLFTGEKKKILLSKAESNSSFYVYDKNLILTNNNAAFIVNNEYEKKPLNVKIDESVYNGIRIRNNFVYYFPSSKLLAKANIEDFISGNSLFKTKTYEIASENEIIGVKDFFPSESDVFWINDFYIWRLNTLTNESYCVNLDKEPKKIFYTCNGIYLLTTNSVYKILYDKTLDLQWITDIEDWEKFTCHCNYLVTSFDKKLSIVDLTIGKQKIIKSNLIKDRITDLIVAGNNLLIIDDLGRFYECYLSSSKIEKLTIELSNSFCVKGNKNLLSYAYRRLSISNDKYLYIISA